MSFGPAQGQTATAIIDEFTTVPGAPNNSILFVNGSGQVDGDSDFGYNEATKACTLPGSVTLSAGQFLAPDGTAAAPSYSFASSGEGDNGMYLSASNTLGFTVAGAGHLFLSAALLEMRNSTTAQGFRIYNTFTNTSNYERALVGWAGNQMSLLVGAAGSGASRQLTIGTDSTSSLGIEMQVGGSARLALAALGNLTFSPGASSSGVATHFTYTGPLDAGMTASTESIAVNWNCAANSRTWAAGAVALQREFLIQAPTYATATFADAVTFAVSGPPVATGTRLWIATFGTLEATTTTPIAGVGIFGAGVTDLVIRNTTNNIEGRVTCTTTIMEVTSASVRLGETSGSVGFYGTIPIALQTGVAVSAAGVHAALVALGLITA